MASLSLDKLSPQAQLGLFIGMAVVMAGVFYMYVESPASITIAEKQQEIATLDAQIAKGRADEQKLPVLRKEIATLEAELGSLKAKLPEEKDVAELLRRIQTLATQSNLVIRGFKPEAIKNQKLHAEWPIGLELEGSYHNLGLFLDQVSKFPRIINVGNIAISTHLPLQGPAAIRAGAPTINVTCVATTFVLIEPAPAAAPGQPQRSTE